MARTSFAYALGAMVFVVNTATAAIVFESAAANPSGYGTCGTSCGCPPQANSQTFLAVNFQILETTTIGSIGGFMSGYPAPIFGAIVALSGPTDVPDSLDLSTPDVIGHTLIQPFLQPDDRSGLLVLTLSPGYYALVFGSDLFGAYGVGHFYHCQTPNGSQVYSINRSNGEISVMSGVLRLFVDTSIVPSFSKVLGSNTVIPGTTNSFTSISAPAIGDGAVAFIANGMNNGSNVGVYSNAGGPLRTVANQNTPIPNGTGNFSLFLTHVSIDDGVVAFRGSRSSPSQAGYYTDVNGTLARRVDLTTPFAGGTGTFTNFDPRLAIDGGHLVFLGSGSSGQRGVFHHDGNTLHVIANTSTLIPGMAMTFDQFSDASISRSNGRGVFIGGRSQVVTGIYGNLGGELETIADSLTLLPGQTSLTQNFTLVRAANGNVAFVAGSVSCIYTNAGGTLTPIVCRGDPMPDIGGTFFSFTEVAFNGEAVAFVATNLSGNRAIFTNLGGELIKVIGQGDALDNFVAWELTLGPSGFDENAIAFYASGSPGRGIYVATYETPRMPGDIDADGDLDGDDIVFFVAVLLGSPIDPNHVSRCDLNGDTITDGRDVKGFATAHINF